MATDQKTESEALFEQFLFDHKLPFERVPVAATSRPDYVVGNGTGWGPILVEVKELLKDDDFKSGQFAVSRRKVGDHIRSKINESRKQVQYGAKQGIPSILLIYNALDPAFQMFGTESHDFQAAMNGDWTLWMSRETGNIVDSGYGKNRSFREDHNTSFTALGHLTDRGGKRTVRLFINEHAKVPLPAELPACFEIYQ